MADQEDEEMAVEEAVQPSKQFVPDSMLFSLNLPLIGKIPMSKALRKHQFIILCSFLRAAVFNILRVSGQNYQEWRYRCGPARVLYLPD
jgi:hypothetical protein